MAETRKIEISVKELNEIIKACHMLSDFLDNFVDRRTLYKEEFI